MSGQLSKRRLKEYSRITGVNKNKKGVEAVTVDYASLYFLSAIICFILTIYIFFKGSYYYMLMAAITIIFVQLNRKINLSKQ